MAVKSSGVVDRNTVRKWRVEPNRYVLYVSRLEPENNAHLVIEAFKKVRTAYRLLIVGDAPYASIHQ
jgi:glycosyltransferase involved in cell wall biosynthesis